MQRIAPVLVVALALTAPAWAQRRKPAPPRIPLSARYTITTSAQDMGSLRVEGRLAQFVRALQQGRREKAASFLSSRAGPAARRSLVERRWLPARPGGKDFGAILYWPDLTIRTMSISGDRRRLVVGPRKIAYAPGKKNRAPTGVIEVPMRKERGDWWVDLLPSTK